MHSFGGLLMVLLVLTSCEHAEGMKKRSPSIMNESNSTERGRQNNTLSNETDRIVMPVVQEELNIQKRRVETGRVRVRKTAQEREVLVEEPLVQEEFNIERVPINRFIEEPVAVRHEGETLIIPVVEEVPVVVKRLRLKEELRVTRRRVKIPHTESVHLRQEHVVIERMRSDESK